jgi:hypothetical protein
MTAFNPLPKSDAWRSLFQNGETCCEVVVIRKFGHPLLVLAGKARFSAQSLALYPAQTFKARRLRDLLCLALRLRLLPLFFSEELRFDPAESFTQKILAKNDGAADFAILCGNPLTEWQRFMILTGGSGNRVVIKAGVSKAAQEVIAREVRILDENQNAPYLQNISERFQTGNVAAFSTAFVAGDSPGLESANEIASILGAWILDGEVALGDLPAWQRLQAAAPDLAPSLKEMGTTRVAVTLAHGDFAPWNIKVTPRGWVVLDWEQGENPGVPGWDWFHFLIQSQRLVLHLSPEQLLSRLQELIASPLFQDYAKRARIDGMEWKLLAAYLEYMVLVTPPKEELEPLKALGRLVANHLSRLSFCPP